MKFFVNETLIERLKNDVLRKAGFTHLTPGDCKTLATAISDNTGFIISETTLKRIYNFAARNHELSLFTLNTLAIFAGYTDWNSYAAMAEPLLQTGNEIPVTGDILLRRCQGQSLIYLRSALKHAKLAPYQVIINSNTEATLNRFIAGSHLITAIVAPVQAGKTATIAAWTLKYYELPTEEQEVILLLINASQLYSFLNGNTALEEWLVNFLSLPQADALCKQSVLLMIDSFDERSFSREKLKILYQRLHEACLKNSDYPSLKVVIITRPSVWCELAADYRPSPDIAEVKCAGSPWLLSTNENNNELSEVGEGLLKSGVAPKDIKQIREPVFSLLRYPLYLNEFALAYQKSGGEMAKAEKWVMDAMATHLNEKLVFSNQQKAKKKIIALVKSKLKEDSPLRYSELPADEPHFRAFYELVDEYIIKEHGDFDIFRDELRLDFTNKAVAAYFISRDLANDPVKSERSSLENIPDAELKDWIWKWQEYHLLETSPVFDVTSLDAVFMSQQLSSKQKLAAFDFLANLHEPDADFIGLLKQVNERFGLLDIFFGDKCYLDYIAVPKEYFIRTMIAICDDDHILHDLLSLLFVLLMYESNDRKIRDLHVTRRLPVVADNGYTDRSVLIETLTDMFLYKIINLHEPVFFKEYIGNIIELKNKDQEATATINLLLLHAYFDAGMLIRPGIFRSIKMLPVAQQSFWDLPYTGMLVTAFILLLQAENEEEITQLEKQLTKMNATANGNHKINIVRCIQLSISILLSQAKANETATKDARAKLANIAGKSGLDWFISHSVINRPELFKDESNNPAFIKQDNHRSA